ncbi:MAG: serine/threonine-protein kinase [Gemmataceae bacterium]
MSQPDENKTRSADAGGRLTSANDTLPDFGRPLDDTPLPLQVAGYEVLGLLGRGGMGVVYKARQPGLGRVVALKMILAGAHADTTDRVRFLREAKSVAELRHPNIVEIYELGEADGLPFFSMEYVEGGTLATRLRAGRIAPDIGAALTETLARTMHHAHQAGIVHRDLKPENVLLAGGKRSATDIYERRIDTARLASDPSLLTPKVSDFGLARRLDTAHGSMRSGGLLGTPSYMAPECADGSGRPATPCADVYALGAILYECLTGRPPFKAATLLETIRLVLEGELIPPHTFAPGTPPELEAICLKSLARAPEDRYATAAELADDLRAWLDGDPTQAAPVTARERLSRWARQAGYELLDEIGRSGTAVVYKARHVNLNRLDALKLLPVHGRDNGETDEWHAFQREATVVARLHHPNIVQIYNLDERRGWAFVSMELADGGSLARRLADGPLPTPLAAALAEMLSRALDCAHAQGVVHRDLNPTNILLTRSDPPAAKVTNFGLVKRFETAQHVTMTGTLMGQPMYLSPEAISGNATVGPPADIYALGVVLYEMLTGRPPFQGTTIVETLALVLKSEPERPSTLRPGVPRDLEAIALRCLRKEPRLRYPSAQALADDLRRFLNEEPIQVAVRSPSAATATKQRSPFLPWTILGAIVLAAAAGTYWLLLNH